MKTFKFPTVLFLFLFTISCTNPDKKTDSAELKNEIDRYLTKTMEVHNIPGLALAVVEGDNIIYEGYFGKATLDSKVAVDKNTLFRVFSLTKLITATGVFQLIQDEKLRLEDKISKYLNDLPLQWQEIKIGNLLSHSSGLPDIVKYNSTLTDQELMDKLSKDKMEFVAGNQFRYNQTNYWLLAQIIEKITGLSFDEFILQNQFKNSKKGVLFSSNSQEVIPNRATRYLYNDEAKVFEKDTNNNGTRGHSGNGLNITLREFTEWNRQLDKNALLDEATKSKMWTPFNFTNNKESFLYGWGNYPVNSLSSYGFSGGNLAAFRKFVDQQTTIILLSNGYEIPAYDIIVNDIARIIIPELKGSTLEEDVMRLVLNSEFDKAALAFENLKEKNQDSDFDNLKWNINSLGNAYLYSGNNPEKAFEVFKFNAEANPDWWVALASLAEIHEVKNENISAIKNYQKAILLNKDNEWNYNEQMKNKIEVLRSN
ncbi:MULTISPECIES: serine hydrolase [unclassified Flagellimonas]|uniref:Serine hydrolase n=1 Tax=Flagellimonas sp. MMG031 TaxID=3158549 RepID=A0AAU7MV42_9FLAO